MEQETNKKVDTALTAGQDKIPDLQAYSLRIIQPEDNSKISHIIKNCLREFGADRDGFAFSDPETDTMFESYNGLDRAYLCIFKGDKLLGGAGFGPVKGLPDASLCELQKMYLIKETRGLGLGHKLLTQILFYAQKSGYKKIYLETLISMADANKLYEKFGFKDLLAPLGDTGHHGCDRWMIRDI